MTSPKKIYVVSLKKLEFLSAVAVRLTRYTGKSKNYVHPKHLLSQNPWYISFLNKKDIVLDLGCGPGQSSIKASRAAKKIVAVDIDPALIRFAKESAQDLKIKNLTFETANLEKKLKYKKNYFDKIIFLDVLEHLNNRDLILKEIHRILKKGGLLLLGVPNSETSWKENQRSVGICSFSDPDHKIEFSQKEITNLLKRHKFEVKEISYSTFDTAYRGLYDLIGAVSTSAYRKISNWRQKKANLNPMEASGFQITAEK